MEYAVRDVVLEQICPALPPRVREAVKVLPADVRQNLTEIRLRRGRLAMGVVPEGDFYLSSDGQPLWFQPCQAPSRCELPASAVMCNEDEWDVATRLVTECSIYALERELAAGYITLRGGHRVGLVGRAVLDGDRVRTQRELSGMNFRIARQLMGVADSIMPYIMRNSPGSYSSCPPSSSRCTWPPCPSSLSLRVPLPQHRSAAKGRDMSVFSTLILSGPGRGKTTLLRDIARKLSYGFGGIGLKVGVVDERSEIAACFDGVPGNDLGPRADVIDSCPKAEGIMIMVRSMSPDVIVTDEIGHSADSEAIEEARRCGVAVIATAHALDFDDAARRPSLCNVLRSRAFERGIVLGSTFGTGTCECIVDLIAEAPVRSSPFKLLALSGSSGGA